MSDSGTSGEDSKQGGLSSRALFLLLFAAMLLATGLAYLLVYPFFHQHTR